MADADGDTVRQYVAERRSALAATDPARLHADAIIDAVDGVMGCLAGLSREALDWRPPIARGNSLAVLAAHVLGNVEEKILATLGGEAVDRSRAQEFRSEGIDMPAVAERWAAVRRRMPEVLEQLPIDAWDEACRAGSLPTLTRRATLLLVHRHASEHLGEAQLIRDLVHARAR